MKRDIRLEAVYPHPRAKVWRALTSSDAIAQWLMPNDFEPRVGHRFTLRTDPAPGFDGTVHCEVLELRPPAKLAFTWVGGPIDTVVTFELDEVERGTRLRFSQTGFEGLQPVIVSYFLGAGSRRIYRKRLPAVLARMRDDGTLAPVTGADADASCEKSWVARSATALVAPLFKRKRS